MSRRRWILMNTHSLPTDYRGQITTILNQNIGSSLPVDFIANGTWFYSSGANISGTGSTDTWLYWNKYSSLDRAELKISVQINDTNSIIRPFRKDTLRGTLAEIDCGNKLLKFFDPWYGNSITPTIEYQGSISFDFVAGRLYEIYLKRDRSLNYLSVRDTVTNNISYISNDFDNSPYYFVGSHWGRPGLSFVSGNISIKNISFTALNPQNPHLAIYGDSYTEGYSLQTTTGSLSNRWNDRIFEDLNGNCLISGRGGATSADLYNRLAVDFDFFNPTYVIIYIGLNDVDYSNWIFYKNLIVGKIEARGATPILCTLPPREDRQAFINEVNTWILAQSDYQIIDMAASLTVGGDRITKISSYYSSEDGFVFDGVHTNTSGQIAQYNQALADAPYLF